MYVAWVSLTVSNRRRSRRKTLSIIEGQPPGLSSSVPAPSLDARSTLYDGVRANQLSYRSLSGNATTRAFVDSFDRMKLDGADTSVDYLPLPRTVYNPPRITTSAVDDMDVDLTQPHIVPAGPSPNRLSPFRSISASMQSTRLSTHSSAPNTQINPAHGLPTPPTTTLRKPRVRSRTAPSSPMSPASETKIEDHDADDEDEDLGNKKGKARTRRSVVGGQPHRSARNVAKLPTHVPGNLTTTSSAGNSGKLVPVHPLTRKRRRKVEEEDSSTLGVGTNGGFSALLPSSLRMTSALPKADADSRPSKRARLYGAVARRHRVDP